MAHSHWMVFWDKKHTDTLVVGTVNVPYGDDTQTDATKLAAALEHADFSVPQLYDLFQDVEPELVAEFAKQHGITTDKVIAALKIMKSKGWAPKAGMEAILSASESIAGSRSP